MHLKICLMSPDRCDADIDYSQGAISGVTVSSEPFERRVVVARINAPPFLVGL